MDEILANQNKHVNNIHLLFCLLLKAIIGYKQAKPLADEVTKSAADDSFRSIIAGIDVPGDGY